MSVKFSELPAAPSVNSDAIVAISQDNGGAETSYKTLVSNITGLTIESGTHNTTWSGAWSPAQTNNIIWKKIGPIVFLFFPFLNVIASASTTLTMDTVLPPNLRPFTFQNLNMSVLNNSRRTGLCTMFTAGGITIAGTDGGANFTSGANCGFDNSTVFYFTA